MKNPKIALVRKRMFKGFKSAFALSPVKGNIANIWMKQLLLDANAATKFLCGDRSSNHRSVCDENVNELVQPPTKQTWLGGGHLPFILPT